MGRPSQHSMVAAWFVALLTASLLVGTVGAAAVTPAAGNPLDKVEKKVLDELATKSETTFWVLVRDDVDLSEAEKTRDWKARGQLVYNLLTERAESSQAGVRDLLRARGVSFEPFWIVNTLRVKAGSEVLSEIAGRPEVTQVIADGAYQIPDPLPGTEEARVAAVEWNIARVNADKVWSSFNDRGEGITIANIDTGVKFNHPALVNQYRGRKPDGTFDHNYNWFDPSRICGNPSLVPCDNNGHGSHTMGTMVGDDGNPGPNQIGVAPRARWIAAKGCESSSCSFDALLRSGQWVMAPTDLNGQNPKPELRAHTVNNSWGGSPTDPFYRETVRKWVAAGIFPAFANGNSGPGCGSAIAPGDYPESYGVGAFDIGNNIAIFSSRGPAPAAFGGGIKPNISAPGVNVRSSWNNDGYVVISGTSMATPHAAAAVALMWSAAPSLLGDIAATRGLLDRTALSRADPQCGGTPENNNVWGRGQLDAFKAVDQSPRGDSTLQGAVTDADTASPIANATVQLTVGPSPRTLATGPDGKYSARIFAGTYTVAASAFGYLADEATVVVVKDQVTTQDFALAKAASYAVRGNVRDSEGRAVANAAVTILNTPIPPAQTGADGAYRFTSVPEGAYEARAEAPGDRCIGAQTETLNVEAGDTTLDFSLPQRQDAYGYFCLPATFNFIDGATVLPLTGFAQSTAVTLPFPFTFYGRSYDTAHVSTSGFLNFLGPNGNPNHRHLPGTQPPNGAIFAFWDLLFVDGQASVRTQLVGAAPNRQFAVEWRNVTFLGDASRVTFEIVLSETGRIWMNYKTIPASPRGQGGSATIGIEDHEGKVALEYSFDSRALRSNMAVLYRVPPSAFVQGNVTDANDGLAVSGATVRGVDEGGAAITAATDKNGFYRLQLRLGSYTIEGSATNYETDSEFLTLNTEDAFVTQEFSLLTGLAELSLNRLEFIVPAGQTRTRTLTLTNSGTGALPWELKESGGGKVATSSVVGFTPNPNYDPNSRTTEGMFLEGAPTGWSITAPGNVIKSWPPTGLSLAWGLGYTGSAVWLSDVPFAKKNHEFSVDGAVTGRKWDTPWLEFWGASMAYDSRRNLMCQLSVGNVNNGIYCWNPNTGAVVETINGAFPWTQISQRGLAYKADDDTFYVGGWNTRILYHIKGVSYPDKGSVIGQCNPPDGSISGLAYNSAADIVWEATNSPSDTIYQLNPGTCAVLGTLPHPAPGFNGAGLHMDETGNLWVVGQNNSGKQNRVYLIESGVPAFNKIPWLNETPTSGTVVAGESQAVQIVLNTTGLQPGVYNGSLFVLVKAGRQSQLRIPISLIVPAYQQGASVNGVAYTDTAGDPWAEDQAWTPDDWGFINEGTPMSTTAPIAGTDDPTLYQHARENPVAYRFEGLPSGTYQVELRFAELDERVSFNERLFDVMLNRQQVLTAYDIALEGGTLAAVNETFFVQVTTGRLDVRFLRRFDSKRDPLINAIRVTHRPDR